MCQVILGYPQLHTYMVFETVETIPLEQRDGVEFKINENVQDSVVNDGAELIYLSYVVRE